MAKGMKTGDRVEVTPNRVTAAREAAVAASGMTPLDCLLSAMRNDDAHPGSRLDAAKAASPYVHPRLAAVEINGELRPGQRIEDPSGEDLMTLLKAAKVDLGTARPLLPMQVQRPGSMFTTWPCPHATTSSPAIAGRMQGARPVRCGANALVKGSLSAP